MPPLSNLEGPAHGEAFANPLMRNDMFSTPKIAPTLLQMVLKMRVVMRLLRGEIMTSVYASWIGQAVILQVAADDLRVPLRGMIVGETDTAVRFRVGEGWDIDIFKPMILAVEQDNWADLLVN